MMMIENNRLRLNREEGGVAEVVGNILTLMITVMIFTTIFVSVQTIRAPEAQNKPSFQGTYEIDSEYMYFNITHMGGRTLLSEETSISLRGDDDSTTRFSFDDDHNGELSDGRWSIGRTLNLKLPIEENADLLISEEIEVLIIDQDSRRILWSSYLKRRDVSAPFVVDSGVEYQVSWENHAKPGDKVIFWADIVDLDTPERDKINVTMYLEELTGEVDPVKMEVRGRFKAYEVNRFILESTLKEDLEEGTYRVPLRADDGSNEMERKHHILLHVGARAITEESDIRITSLTFEPSSVISLDELDVKATIINRGGKSAVVNTTFYDRYPDGTELLKDERTTLVPAGGGVDVWSRWTVEQSGLHEIRIVGEVGYQSEELVKELFVHPNILLIDDSRETASSKEVEAMERALLATGTDYEYIIGSPSPGRLNRYEVVIWMTGETRQNTLDAEERSMITEYLKEDNKLWLIGDGIVNDAQQNNWINWIENNFHASPSLEGSSPQSTLIGYGEPLTHEMEFEVKEGAGFKKGNYVTPISGGISMLRDSGSDHRTAAVSFNGTSERGKTVFQSFLFSALSERDASGVRLSHEVLDWFGGLKGMREDDLALVYQEVDPKNPDYMDTVEITAMVINTGPSSFDRVEVVLKIDGVVEDMEMIQIDGEGTTAQVTFEWLAEEVGTFDIKVIVDPYDGIEEKTLENNRPDYLGIDTEIEVRYTILIVDDGDEEKRSSESGEEVRYVYEELGYVHDFIVTSPENQDPDQELMGRYNTVVWVTGSREEPLDEYNRENITDYLKVNSASLLLIGDNIVYPGTAEYRDFLQNVLRIDPSSSKKEMPAVIYGIDNDPITHGMEYHLESDMEKTYVYQTLHGSSPIFFDDEHVIGSRYHDTINDYRSTVLNIDALHFERAFQEKERGWYEELEVDLTGSSLRKEFLYMTTRWFGKEDVRVELRVSEPDIYLESDTPMLTRSYGIRADIENVGGTGSSALIHFKDGDSHIDTESVFIPAGGKAAAEVKWEPINAGPSRPIRVIVDPYDTVPEIPNMPGEEDPVPDQMGFNNQAIIDLPVYYFYDDMESGTDKWTHEAQLAFISGGSPLDFLSGGLSEIDSNVVEDWEDVEGTTMVDWDVYSDPYSYFMQEPVGRIGVDALVVLAIDTSGSMENREVYCEEEGDMITWLDMAKRASKVLVNELSENSAVGVWEFGGTNPRSLLSPPIRLEGSGRAQVLNAIDDMSATPQTPLWDTVGEAYMDARTAHQELFPELEPNVVVLSDGADNHAADGSAAHKAEKGSEDWAPWHDMDPNSDYPEIFYPDHYGKYRLPYDEYEEPDEAGKWLKVSDSPGAWDQSRKGLLNSPIPIFTIGLGLENNPDVFENPDDPDWNPAPDFYSAGPKNYMIERKEEDRATWEAGTTEYNLWRIATTSNAEYFYSPGGEELEDIFETIAYRLVRPANLTSIGRSRISEASLLSNSELPDFPFTEHTNKDKYAVTPSFDLTEKSSAWLTFWHRYQIIQGRNGAYVEIGYHDQATDEYVWEQAHPVVGPYTGNLLQEEYDEIVWAWNGKSDRGTGGWEHVRFNVVSHLDRTEVPIGSRDQVRVRFYYKQFGPSNRPGGWLIDNVGITASRRGDSGENIGEQSMDAWHITDSASYSGDHSWWNAHPVDGFLPDGVDNRLTTVSIDLTRAKTAVLEAKVRYNINTKSGTPPDGFRVEVTTDDGRTWESLNQGVRAASGYSHDLPYSNEEGWVKASDLERLNVDLSPFSGEIIKLSFRVVTNDVQEHYEYVDGFGGLFIDDVIVSGETD